MTAPNQGTTAEATQGPAPARERLPGDPLFRFLRGWGIIAVIIVHWTMDRWSPPPEILLDWTPRAQMRWFPWVIGIWVIPGFFFASAALSAKSLGREAARPWLAKRMRRVLVPYYAMAIVVAGGELLAGMAGIGRCSGFNIGSALSWLIPFPHQDCLIIPSMALWYVTAFVLLTLFCPLLYRLSRSLWGQVAWIAVAIGTLVWTGITLDPIFDAVMDGTIDRAVLTGQAATTAQFTAFFLAHVVAWPVFVLLGFAYARGVPQKLGNWLVPIGLGLLGLGFALVAVDFMPTDMIVNLQPPSLTMLFGATGALLLAIWGRDKLGTMMYATRTEGVIEVAGRHSYTLYLWHMPVFAAVWWAVAEAGILEKPFMVDHPLGANVILALVAAPLLVVTTFVMRRFESGRFTKAKDKAQPAPAS